MLNLGVLGLGHWNSWRTLSSLIETRKSRLRCCGRPKLLLSKTFVKTLYPKPSKAFVVPRSTPRNLLLARFLTFVHDAGAWSFPADVLDG